MLKIFNTLNKKKELFKSIQCKLVNIYVCGITVSNYCHIGHGRTFYFFDILVNYLKHIGYKCNYVRNITDVDNKLIKKSLQKKISLKDLSYKMIINMWNNFNNLNFSKPSFEPKITDHIKIIIKEIKKLIVLKYAYISLNGDVYFKIKKYLNKNIFLLKKNIDIFKKDFVLWKVNKGSLNYGWKSPWGKGIPGWHIGCSVISNKYLNNNIDIHGGGYDLIFPHHENDIIQSKCLYGNKYKANYWIHTGMVLNIKGCKLSKSKDNNIYRLCDLLKIYHSDVLKFFFMSTHYRKNLYFNSLNFIKYKECINKLYLCLNNLNLNINLKKKDYLIFKEFDDLFYNYMNDDLNIPKVYTLIFYMMHEINKFKCNNFSLANKLALRMRYFANIIGILNSNINYYLKNKLSFKIDIKKINKIVRIRNLARKRKKWYIADLLRNKLYKLNVLVRDKKKFNSDWYLK